MKYISFLTLVFAVVIQVFFVSHSAKAQTYHPRYAPGTIIYAPQYNINIYGGSYRPRGEPVTRRVYQGPNGTYRQVVYGRPVHNSRGPVYFRAAPRVAGSGGACARISNSGYRHACLCSVSNGGIARRSPNGQVFWTRHHSGAAYHGFQRCMAAR